MTSHKDVEDFLRITTAHCNNPQNIPKQLHSIPIRELLIMVPSILFNCDFSVPLFADFLKTENTKYRLIFDNVNSFLSIRVLKRKHNGDTDVSINPQELLDSIKGIEPYFIENYIIEVRKTIVDFLENNLKVPVVIKSKAKIKPSVVKNSSILPLSGGRSRKKKNIEEICKGTVYVIDGKKWCVGEKKISKKWGTKKSKKNMNKTVKKG